MAKTTAFNQEQEQKRRSESAERASRSSPRVTGLSRRNERPNEQKAATYRIGQVLITRINEAAKTRGIEKTSFVKALLIYALDQLEADEFKLPPAIEPEKKVKLKLD